MKHFVHSEPGDSHLNEDVVMVRRHTQSGTVLLCTLADGQGGQSGGAAAARLAVTECISEASKTFVGKLFDATAWHILIGSADTSVMEEDEAGFSTLVSLCVDGRKVVGASCGDSAALLLHNGTARWLTDRQRKNPPIGSGEAFSVAFKADLNGSWKLLLMSDGVWRYVGYEAIAEMAARHRGEELIATLRQAAQDGNKGKLGDDFSVILVQSD